MKEVWVIIPVHNRMAVTRACLGGLRSQGLLAKLTVCVVDDGCSDGTREMLEQEYPEVEVVAGDGNLYWGGGIAAGMKVALAAGAEVVVWLNDDCRPDPGSIEVLVSRVRETRGLCGGVSFDPTERSVVNYSGVVIGGPPEQLLCPGRGEHVPVDVINGNLVAVHRDLVAAIGPLPAERFPHYGGDSVYSLRARRAGKVAEVAGSATAVNPRDKPLERFGASRPVTDLWKEPFRVASCLHFRTHWNLLREAYGAGVWLRWPSYVLRLFGLTIAAWRRQRRAMATPVTDPP